MEIDEVTGMRYEVSSYTSCKVSPHTSLVLEYICETSSGLSIVIDIHRWQCDLQRHNCFENCQKRTEAFSNHHLALQGLDWKSDLFEAVTAHNARKYWC